MLRTLALCRYTRLDNSKKLHFLRNLVPGVEGEGNTLLVAIGTQKLQTNMIYDLFDFTFESAKWCHDNVMYWTSE